MMIKVRAVARFASMFLGDEMISIICKGDFCKIETGDEILV